MESSQELLRKRNEISPARGIANTTDHGQYQSLSYETSTFPLNQRPQGHPAKSKFLAVEDDIDVLAFEADYRGDPSTIEALVRNVLDHDNKIDGIFISGSDSHVAAIAMELAKQSGKPLAGLTVVSSISNIELLGPMNLGIDYIDIRLHDIGLAVATTLLWRIQNPTVAYRKIMIQPLVLEPGDRLQ